MSARLERDVSQRTNRPSSAAHHVFSFPPLSLQARYDFPSPWWDTISPAAKELVKSLLKLNPEERMSADQVERNAPFLPHVAPAATPLIFPAATPRFPACPRVYSSF